MEHTVDKFIPTTNGTLATLPLKEYSTYKASSINIKTQNDNGSRYFSVYTHPARFQSGDQCSVDTFDPIAIRFNRPRCAIQIVGA